MSVDLPGRTAHAEAIVRERWYAIGEADAREIVAAVEQLSDAELLERPQLLVGAVIALNLITGTAGGGDRASLLERYSNVVEIAAASRAVQRDQPRWWVIRMIAARWKGDLDRALDLSDRLGRSASALGVRAALLDEAHDVDRPGYVALQRGLTVLLAGRTSEAMEHFAAAHRGGGLPPYRHFAGMNAAANAAMLAAFEGHDAMARTWLARVGDPDLLPEWCRDLVTLGATIASTVLATDVVDVDAGSRHARTLEAAGERFELWPFQVAALTAHDLARGAPVDAYMRLKQVGFARNTTIAVESIADHVVFRAYLDTLIAGGEGGLVLRLAEDRGTPLRALVPIARTRLLAGDHVGAARVASRAMRRVLIPKRDMWEATVVHAVASMRLGDADAALRSFGIVAAGGPWSLPAILARQRRTDVEDLYSLAGAELPATLRHSDALSAEIVALTDRERRILQHLVDGLTPAQIAVSDVTSEHTVRTHVKRIYRKLGVNSRNEAIARANHHGLVRWDHVDGRSDTVV